MDHLSDDIIRRRAAKMHNARVRSSMDILGMFSGVSIASGLCLPYFARTVTAWWLSAILVGFGIILHILSLFPVRYICSED